MRQGPRTDRRRTGIIRLVICRKDAAKKEVAAKHQVLQQPPIVLFILVMIHKQELPVLGGVILQNKSRKPKTVADNAILRNYAVPSENISERIKIKQRTAFTSNEMSVYSAEMKTAPENSQNTDIYL